jgi:hypothetical protein
MRKIYPLLSAFLSFCLLVALSGAAASLPNVHAKVMRGTAAMDCHAHGSVHAQTKEAPANAALNAVGEKIAPSCCVLVIALFEPSPLSLPRASKAVWRLVDSSHTFSFLSGGIYRPPRMSA